MIARYFPLPTPLVMLLLTIAAFVAGMLGQLLITSDRSGATSLLQEQEVRGDVTDSPLRDEAFHWYAVDVAGQQWRQLQDDELPSSDDADESDDDEIEEDHPVFCLETAACLRDGRCIVDDDLCASTDSITPASAGA